jgi:hypothetical protein
MKLTDVQARFWSGNGRHGMGISLLCPLCRTENVSVPFANPIDGGAPAEGKGTLWDRTGETIETLTLHPSINAEGCCSNGCPGWHGWIKAGEVT